MYQRPMNISDANGQSSMPTSPEKPADGRWHPRVDQGQAVGKSDEIPFPPVQTGVKPFKIG